MALRFGLIPVLIIIFLVAIKPMLDGDTFTGILMGLCLFVSHIPVQAFLLLHY